MGKKKPMKYLHTASRTTEVDAVSDQIVAMYEARTALKTEPYLAATMATLKSQSEQITEAIKRLKILSELEDLDAVRDRAISALGHVLNGYANMPTDDARQHTPPLKKVFDNYTLSITRENYESESSLIESLLADLSATALQVHITALPGVSEAIAAVRAAQTAFTTKQVAYLEALAKDKTLQSASVLKLALLTTINTKLIRYLDVMKDVDAAKYADFAAAVAQAVDEQNTAMRHTLDEKKKKEGNGGGTKKKKGKEKDKEKDKKKEKDDEGDDITLPTE